MRLTMLLLAVCICAAGARAERLRAYEELNFGGNSTLFSVPQETLDAETGAGKFKSAKVISGRWLLCERPSYAGNCVWISRDVPSFGALAVEGDFGSARPERVPTLRREWGGRHLPSRSALVFFSEKDFRGGWVALDQDIADLREKHVTVRPASIVLQRGAWRVCTQPNFTGSCLSMTASAWDLEDIFTTEIRSVRRLP